MLFDILRIKFLLFEYVSDDAHDKSQGEKHMTSLTRWNPFPRTAGWPFDFWSDYAPVRRASNAPFKLGVDVIQNPDNYTIKASLPGFSAEDIDVTVDDGVLRIVATNSSGETSEKQPLSRARAEVRQVLQGAPSS